MSRILSPSNDLENMDRMFSESQFNALQKYSWCIISNNENIVEPNRVKAFLKSCLYFVDASRMLNKHFSIKTLKNRLQELDILDNELINCYSSFFKSLSDSEKLHNENAWRILAIATDMDAGLFTQAQAKVNDMILQCFTQVDFNREMENQNLQLIKTLTLSGIIDVKLGNIEKAEKTCRYVLKFLPIYSKKDMQSYNIMLDIFHLQLLVALTNNEKEKMIDGFYDTCINLDLNKENFSKEQSAFFHYIIAMSMTNNNGVLQNLMKSSSYYWDLNSERNAALTNYLHTFKQCQKNIELDDIRNIIKSEQDLTKRIAYDLINESIKDLLVIRPATVLY